MEYLKFIFSSFWVFSGTTLLLLIITDKARSVLRKISNEFDKLIDKFKKKGNND